MSNRIRKKCLLGKWWTWSGLLALAIFLYVAGFYASRDYTQVTYIVDGKFRAIRLVSLAQNEIVHKLLVCLYLPFVLSDCAELAPTFGYLPAKRFPDDYQYGSKFYLSGDEIREALDAEPPL